jgi:L-fucose isomerase-like protein
VTSALVVPIGRTTFDLDLAAERVLAARCVLPGLGVETVGPQDVVTTVEGLDDAVGHAPGASLAVVLQATFSDSSMVGRLADATGLPLLVWSFPEARTGGRLRLNSLCGANLAAYLLRRRPHPARFVHADPAGSETAEMLRAAVQDLLAGGSDAATGGSDGATGGSDGVVEPGPDAGPRASEPAASTGSAPKVSPGPAAEVAVRVRRQRIGLVGDPPVGFEPCLGDDRWLSAVTGLEVDRLPLEDLFRAADAVAPAARDDVSRRVRATLDVGDDVAAAGMAESVALYGGLAALAEQRGWSALATRCWPECMTQYGGAVCTPMAMLTEDGVPGVCEADLFGAATALLLRHVSGSDPFVADLVDADEADGTSVVWHCGVASTQLARDGGPRTAITHPNRHRALANQFALRPGRVTVARLSQAGGRPALVLGGGEMLDRPRPFTGTCGVLRWDRPVRDVLATVFDRGLEHHLGLVYGDHGDALHDLAHRWSLPVVVLGGRAGGRPGGADTEGTTGGPAPLPATAS